MLAFRCEKVTPSSLWRLWAPSLIPRKLRSAMLCGLLAARFQVINRWAGRILSTRELSQGVHRLDRSRAMAAE
jgi:hypothetical protein